MKGNVASKVRFLIAVFFTLAVATTAIADAAIQYLCVTERATGFQAKKNWEVAQFKGGKFIIRPFKKGERDWLGQELSGPVVFSEVGDKSPTGDCVTHNGAIFHCEGPLKILKFNRESLRFEAYLYGGYLEGSNSNTAMQDVAVQIGQCSKF